MPPLLDVDGVAKKCDRIVLQGTQEVLKVRHDENEVNIERNRIDYVPVRSYLRQKSKNASRLDKQ